MYAIRSYYVYPPFVVVSRLLLVIVFAVYWQSLNSVMTGMVLAGLICFLFVLIYSLKGIGVWQIKKVINLQLAKKQIKYSWPFGLALVLNTLALQFDKIICISFLDPASFATYAIVFYGIPGVQQVYRITSYNVCYTKLLRTIT